VNWNAIGAIGEVVGAAGVIASLVYLAVQIRQNSAVARLALHENYITGVRAIFDNVHAHPHLYRVWRLATNSPDEMSEEDREQFGMLLYALFNRIHLGYQAREVDPFMAQKYLADIDSAFTGTAAQAWWSRQRGTFDPAFAEVVDERLRRAQAKQQSAEGAA